VPWAASGGYYEEAREGQIIPEGSQTQSGTPIVLGRGYANFGERRVCELRRMPIPRTRVNKGK
jgi:hypothetical protein